MLVFFDITFSFFCQTSHIPTPFAPPSAPAPVAKINHRQCRWVPVHLNHLTQVGKHVQKMFPVWIRISFLRKKKKNHMVSTFSTIDMYDVKSRLTGTCSNHAWKKIFSSLPSQHRQEVNHFQRCSSATTAA